MTNARRAVDRADVQARTFALVLGAVVVGCGGAPPPEPKQPAPPAATPEHQSLSELDALEHDLDVANDRLGQELLQKQRERLALQQSSGGPGSGGDVDQDGEAVPPKNKGADKGTPKPEKPKPAPTTTPARPEPAPPPDQPAGVSPTGVGSPCDIACRALASMRRSADKICELAGASSERCARAKDKVKDAEQRVSDAGCECKKDGGMLMSRAE